MLTTEFVEGARPICEVIGGRSNGVIIYAVANVNQCKGLPIKEFSVEDGTFALMSSPTLRVSFITGPPGSGKSFFAREYLLGYARDHPGVEMFLFSTVDNDVSLEGLPLTRIIMDQEMVDKEFDVKEFPDNCVMLFDDTDQVMDEKLLKAVHNLIRRVIQIGRHKNIQVIITSHSILGNGVKMSKVIMGCLNSYTFFPMASSAQQLNYALGAHLNVTKVATKKMIAMEDTRWVTLLKEFPPIVLTEHYVTFLNKL